MSSLSERVKTARKQAGYTQVQLAEMIGVSQNTITKIEAGGNTTHINKIAKALGVTSEWLEFGTGSSNLAVLESNEEDYIVIDVLNVEASAGHGSEGDLVEIVSQLRYVPEQFYAIFRGMNPETLSVINIKGDSMYPTFNSGDMIFVDESIKYFDGDGIYVFTYKGLRHVKRLQFAGDHLIVISDNNFYKEWYINEEHIEQLHIHGKVKVHQSQKLNFIG